MENNNFKEIERKWLIETLPEDLPLIGGYLVYQGYISINPEIRIRSRKSRTDDQLDLVHFLTFKSDGDLERKEIDIPISQEHYNALKDTIPYELIQKYYYKYELPNGLCLECFIVDNDTDTGFIYAEVEFPDKVTADNFVPPFDTIEEVTYDKRYKMKNYWKRTRVDAVKDKKSNEIPPLEISMKVHYLGNDLEELRYTDGEKSDWVDLRAAKDISMKTGDFVLIPLGVAMELPAGYEALVVPRSSTYKNFGIIQANSMAVIDESFNGTNDQWLFPAIAMRDTVIKKGSRICQFRIIKHQPKLSFVASDELNSVDRGGIGFTGVE